MKISLLLTASKSHETLIFEFHLWKKLSTLMRPGRDQRAHLEAALDPALNDGKVVEELQKEVAVATQLGTEPRQVLVLMLRKGYRLQIHEALDKDLPNYPQAAIRPPSSLRTNVTRL